MFGRNKSRPSLVVEQLEDRALLSAGPLDDFANTLDGAAGISFDDFRAPIQIGTLDYPGDVDVFSFNAPETGSLLAHLFAGRDSSLDAQLVVRDQAGREIGRNDNLAGDVPDAQVAFEVVAGRTYFVEATASTFAPITSPTQSYILTLTPYDDDLGSSPATAATVAGGNVSRLGRIEHSGDADVFSFVASTSTGLSLHLSAVDGRLDTHLSLLDDQGRVLADNDDSLDTLNSLLTFSVEAGRRYYVRAAASPNALVATSTGDYRVTITPFADEAGATLPQAVALDAQRAVGTIGAAGDSDLYRFVAERTGPVAIQLTGTRGLDASLAVLNDLGRQLLVNDDIAASTTDSRVLLDAIAGQTYYLRAGGNSTSTGDYTLSLTPYRDDAGNNFASAGFFSTTLDLIQRIETAGDVDFLLFRAETSGDVFVEMTAESGPGVVPDLAVFDAANHLLAQRNDADTPGRARILFSVAAGNVYYLRVAGGVAGVGDYRLSFGPLVDDFGNDLAAAQPLLLPLTGTATQFGVSGTADADLFRFVAPYTGALAARLEAFRSSVDPLLHILDAAGNTLVANDDTGGSRNSRVALEIVAGQTYFVRVSSLRTAGEYVLTLAPYDDDAPGLPAEADTLAFTDRVTLNGRIEVTGDTDVYRFVAPFTGQLVARQNAATGSNLDSFLSVLDANGATLAQDDESGGRRGARVVVTVQQGRTYFVSAAAFPASFATAATGETGAYELTLAPAADDFVDTIEEATTLTLAGDGTAQVQGEIGRPFDVDVLRFVPTLSGPYALRQQADGGVLDALLTLRDATGAVLASNDDSDGSLDSRLNVALTADTVYFLEASAFLASQGSYLLSVTPLVDDYASTTADAATVALASNKATLNGVIEAAGDVDVFRYVAERTGGLIVQQQSAGGGLDPLLRVRAGDGTLLDENDDSDGTLDSKLLINVEAGEVYFLEAAAFQNSSGAYVLTLTAYDDNAPNGPTGAVVLPLSEGATVVAGAVEVVGDSDFFQFVAPSTGTLRLSLRNADGEGFLDGFLSVLTDAGAVLAENEDVAGTLNSAVALDVVAGQTYLVRAGASPLATGLLRFGNYRLTLDAIVPPADDAGNTLDTAADLVLGANRSLTRRGQLERAGDLDFYRFVAPVSGPFVFRLESNHFGDVDPILTLFDADGTLLQLNDDRVGDQRLDSLLRADLSAGQTYFLQAAGYGGSTGSYRLLAHPDEVFPDDAPDLLGDAAWMFIAPGTTVTRVRRLERPWDHDVLALVTQAPGEVVVRVTAHHNGFTPLVSVFDFEGRGGPHTFPNGDPIPELSVAGGNNFLYYLDVAAADLGSSVADFYTLEIFYSDDDFPDIIVTEPRLGFTNNATQVNGTLNKVNDLDNVAFTAPTTGSFVLRLEATGSAVAPRLTLRDGQREVVASATGIAGGAASFAVTLAGGGTYFVEAAGAGLALGDYRLSIAPTPDEDNGAVPAFLGPVTQRVQANGFIGLLDDTDTFAFVPVRSGDYRLRVDAQLGSELNGRFTLTDQFGNVVAANDDFDNSPNSQAFARLEAGQVYLATVSASPNLGFLGFGDPRIGGYSLSIAPVMGLPLDQPVFGQVMTVGGGELYSFVAPRAGGVSLDLRGELFGVDTFLRVYDAQGRAIASNNDSGGTTDSALRFNVPAGSAFFVEATASPFAAPSARLGGYLLQANLGAAQLDQSLGAEPIALDPGGQGGVNAVLGTEGEQRVFRFQARQSGTMTVRNTATASPLDATFYVYDSASQLLATARGATGQATFEAVARQTYYVRVAATPFADPGTTVGPFNVNIGPDDVGGFDNAATLLSNATGSLDGLGDLDVFQLLATTTGQTTVNLSSATGGRVTGVVTVYDSHFNELASSSGSATFSASAGESYTVSVSSGDSSTSKYSLDSSVETSSNVPDPTPTTTVDTTVTVTDSAESFESGDESSTTNLVLFTDPQALEEGAADLERAANQVADLQSVGDSSAALVAILLVTTGDELLLDEEAAEGEGENPLTARLDDWLSGAEEKDAVRATDAVFALLAEVDAAEWTRRVLRASLNAARHPELLVELCRRAVRTQAVKGTPPVASAEPDIADLLIPDPLPASEPPARPPREAMPELDSTWYPPAEDERFGLNPVAASLALATLGWAIPRASAPRVGKRKPFAFTPERA